MLRVKGSGLLPIQAAGAAAPPLGWTGIVGAKGAAWALGALIALLCSLNCSCLPAHCMHGKLIATCHHALLLCIYLHSCAILEAIKHVT